MRDQNKNRTNSFLNGERMIGKVEIQSNLFSTENTYKNKLKPNSFYAFLSGHRHEVFKDEDYQDLYCTSNGRPSVPPSIIASACLLQSYDRISDEEAVARATFDVRWSVALGTELAEQPFAKSTLQEFRAKLILNKKGLAIFQRSLSYAREQGYLKNRKMRIAMDTTHILGKGAVKDTYNLLADGIKALYTTLQKFNIGSVVEKFADKFGRYFGKSFKGEANIDWDNETARQQLLTSLASDARSLMDVAQEEVQSLCASDAGQSEKVQAIQQAASLLSSLLMQDVEIAADNQAKIKEGVAKDRIISTTDTEMRHGRKSASNRFNGHKAAVAVDTETQLITAVDVVAGNIHDGETAQPLVEQTESNTANQVETALGDCAYGTAAVREQFENTDVRLIAKTPKSPNGEYLSKHEFKIDIEKNTVTCPAGQKTTTYKEIRKPFGPNNEKRNTKQFYFSAAVCAACPLFKRCIRSPKPAKGRMIELHPREDLLQQARNESHSDLFREQYHKRVVVEHSIARLVRRGIRKSRYFGRTKTLWQVAMAAAVVNLMMISRKQLEKATDSFSFLHLYLFKAEQFAGSLISSIHQAFAGSRLLQLA